MQEAGSDALAHNLNRTRFTHTALFSIAEDSLSRGEQDSNPSDFLTAMVMAAFAFEAYLNFAGETKIQYWSEIDRIPTKKKLAVLCTHAGFSPDFGKRPFQTLVQLWRFRDTMAHARTETVSVTNDGPPTDPPSYPETDWEKQCNSRVASRAVTDTRESIRTLHKSLGMTSGPLGMIAEQGGQILTRLPEQQER